MKNFVLLLACPVLAQDYPIPVVLVDPDNNYNYADYNYEDTTPIIPEGKLPQLLTTTKVSESFIYTVLALAYRENRVSQKSQNFH